MGSSRLKRAKRAKKKNETRELWDLGEKMWNSNQKRNRKRYSSYIKEKNTKLIITYKKYNQKYKI